MVLDCSLNDVAAAGVGASREISPREGDTDIQGDGVGHRERARRCATDPMRNCRSSKSIDMSVVTIGSLPSITCAATSSP